MWAAYVRIWVLFILVREIYYQGIKLELVKRFSAQLFRRKIESSAKLEDIKSTSETFISKEYLSYFELTAPTDEHIFISPEKSPLNDVTAYIQKWIDGESEEHTLAIQGEKGIGKSSLFKQIENSIKVGSQVTVVSTSITEKIITQNDFLKFLSRLLKIEIESDLRAILDLDSKQKKYLVLIDEGQNLFLAKRGGFHAFHFLSKIINLRTDNIFWCFTFNLYSWVYLNAVTGGSQFFRKVFSIGRWSDTDIQNLILQRHEKSGHLLEFDPIIYAFDHHSKAYEGTYLKDKFFEMLWHQSKGNPRTALVLWRSSLEQTGDKKIKVGIPQASPIRPLEGLTDEELFVIAAIIRHENLTVTEAIDVTSLSETVVRHAIRVGLEREFLSRSKDGRYRILPLWQSALTTQLVSKNFVYV